MPNMPNMPNKRLLLQWIGHSDLRAMAVSLPTAQREEILAEIKGPVPEGRDVGPTKTLLDTQSFDEICLLSNYRAEWNKLYLDWLGGKSKLVRVDLKKPTDYVSIFQIADAEMAKIRKRSDWGEIELCLHLSPGTPAMAAVWLLLGKTRYPETFDETFAGRSWVTEIPFDLTIDVIPDLLRNLDLRLRQLAAESPGEILGFEQIAGDCQALRIAVGRAKRAAMRSVPVLLLGESGTGKEMFARAIHDAGPRRNGPFVPVDCTAISHLKSGGLAARRGIPCVSKARLFCRRTSEKSPPRWCYPARFSRDNSRGEPFRLSPPGLQFSCRVRLSVRSPERTNSLESSRVH